jgi:hypothetical protein
MGTVLTSFIDGSIQLAVHAGYMFFQSSMIQNAPQLGIVVDMARVQVVSDSSLEECRILWNYGQSTSEIQQADRRGVQSINTASVSSIYRPKSAY